MRDIQRLNTNSNEPSQSSPAIVCSPATIDECRTSGDGSKSSATAAAAPDAAANHSVIQNGVRDDVSRAALTKVHAEIDSLKKMTHSVIEKLDTLTASFQELRNLNLINRLDVQADSLTELKKMVSSHAQSTNDRITDLSTVVETLSNRVEASSHQQIMLATQLQAAGSTTRTHSHSPRPESESNMKSLSPSPAGSSRSSVTTSSLSMSPVSSRDSPRAPTSVNPLVLSSPVSVSTGSQSVDILQESICELRAFTKETFENFERIQRTQHKQLLPTLNVAMSAVSSSSFSPLCSPSATKSTLKRRNSASARKGRSKHAQQLARARRADSAPGPPKPSAILCRRGTQRPVRPRIWGYGTIAFLIMLVVMFCYFFPALVPYLEGLPQLL